MAQLSLPLSSTAFVGRWATSAGGFVLAGGDGCRFRNLLEKSVYIDHTEEATRTCTVCKKR